MNYPDMVSDFDEIAKFLLSGGILIYPTETFYAVGCAAYNESSCRKIFELKRRKPEKPLPILAGSKKQAEKIVFADYLPPAITDIFWPGPLTLIVPERQILSSLCVNASGKCAIRVTSHPQTARLANKCGFPFTCSSANFSGFMPACSLSEISGDFLSEAAKIGCIIADFSAFSIKNSLPSTIIEPSILSDGSICARILRKGCIDKDSLQRKNIKITD